MPTRFLLIALSIALSEISTASCFSLRGPWASFSHTSTAVVEQAARCANCPLEAIGSNRLDGSSKVVRYPRSWNRSTTLFARDTDQEIEKESQVKEGKTLQSNENPNDDNKNKIETEIDPLMDFSDLGEFDPSKKIPIKREVLVGNPQLKVKKKEKSVTQILQELAEIQQKGPRKYCILGTRHCSYLHQQIIELL